MRLILVVLVAVLSTGFFAQAQSTSDVCGVWTVIHVDLLEMKDMTLNADQKQKLELMKNGFNNAVLEFNVDSSCRLAFSENAPDFIKELENHHDLKWRYNSHENTIMVGTVADDFTFIGFQYQKLGDKIIFTIPESPFVLEVIRK